ncbi:MAG: molybdate ABC transporter permease subunit, partial [Calditrichaeota bacterium]|nr:molybdate ABC transporter permease subunit [Calditrichota bacterium]
MTLSAQDLGALWLTLRLAATSTALLLLLGTPLAWWLARSRWRAKVIVEALVALPLVLPPTVLGFYLLQAFAPDSALGRLWRETTGGTLVFSFTGLVLASVIVNLP